MTAAAHLGTIPPGRLVLPAAAGRGHRHLCPQCCDWFDCTGLDCEDAAVWLCATHQALLAAKE